MGERLRQPDVLAHRHMPERVRVIQKLRPRRHEPDRHRRDDDDADQRAKARSRFGNRQRVA